MFEDNGNSEDCDSETEEPFLEQARALYDEHEHRIYYASNIAYNFHESRNMTFDYFMGLCWAVRNAESALKEAERLDRDYGLDECKSRRLTANVEYAQHIKRFFMDGPGKVLMPVDISQMPTSKGKYSGKRG